MLIKEFCGGKAGWNDRVIVIETDLKPASEPGWPLPGVLPNTLPLLAFDLRKSSNDHHPLSLPCGPF